MGRLWRLLSTLVTVFVIATLVAYGLGRLSDGIGATILVDEGPIFPTHRIALGERIRYGVRWRYQYGGCDSYTVTKYTHYSREGDETTLFQRSKLRPLPVGEPGYELFSVQPPLGIFPGRWKYEVSIESVNCPNNRKPPIVSLVDFYVDIYDPRSPVVTIESLVLISPTVRAGEFLKYRLSYTRRITATGVNVATFTAEHPQPDDSSPDVVTTQRPIAYTQAGTYRDVDVQMVIPPSLRPGRWRVQLTSIQDVGGRQQIDYVGEMKFEVVP